MKKSLVVLASLPTLLLAGCFGEKEPIQPDKEPVEIEQQRASDPDENPKLTIADVSSLFTDDRYLDDYKAEMKKAGYEKPVKEILLEDSEAMLKKGLVYEVEDGFAIIEFDSADERVIATTGYETLEQINLQEMKTKAYQLERQLNASKDEGEKKKLEAEVNRMWEDIGKIEADMWNN